MKEVPIIETTVRDGKGGFYKNPLYSETDFVGDKKVYKCSTTGNNYDLGHYNPDSLIVEMAHSELMDYLMTYKGYTIIATTPITSTKVWKGSGESSTYISYTLKKPI